MVELTPQGDVNLKDEYKVSNAVNPIDDQDLATKKYVDSFNRKNIIVLDNFQTENWIEGGSNTGTLTYDTTDFSSGSKSLKYVTNGDGTATQDQIYKDISFSFTENMHNYIEVDYKITNPTNVTRFYISLFVSVSGNDYYHCNFEATGRKWSSADDWETARIPLTSFIPNSVDATGGDIERIRFIVSDDTTPITIRINSVRLVSEPVKTYAVFTFDDSNKSIYTKAAPIMEKYGFKGTSFNIKENIDLSGQYMTSSDVIDLEHRGWCNGLHGQSPNSEGWANLTEPELDKYISDNIRHFRGLGISSGLDIVAYPNGNYGGDKDDYIYQIIKKYCRLGRATNTSHTNALLPSDNLRLTVGEYYLQVSNPVADVVSALDDIKTKGGIVIFVGHDIVDSSASGGDYLTSDFTTVVEKVAELSSDGLVEVVTMSELRDILIGMNSITTNVINYVPTYLGNNYAPNSGDDVGSVNRAYFIPISVPTPLSISNMNIRVNTSSGNIDVGIYKADGTLIESSGSTTCPTTGTAIIPLSNTATLQEGIYYLAISADNVTATFNRAGTIALTENYYRNSSFPLPSSVGDISNLTYDDAPAYSIIGKVD